MDLGILQGSVIWTVELIIIKDFLCETCYYTFIICCITSIKVCVCGLGRGGGEGGGGGWGGVKDSHALCAFVMAGAK